MKTKDIKQGKVYHGRNPLRQRVVVRIEGDGLMYRVLGEGDASGADIVRICRVRTFAAWAQKSAW